MKVVLLTDSIDTEEIESIEGIQLSYNWNDNASIVIYKDDIAVPFSKWKTNCEAQHFVSLQNFLKLKELEVYPLTASKTLIKKQLSTKMRVTEVISFCDSTATDLFPSIHSQILVYLKQISVELIQNGIKASAACSESIIYSIEENDEYIILCVEDEAGLLDRDTFFGKIKRALESKTFEEKKNGAGLGLYMMSGLTDAIIVKVIPNRSTMVKCIVRKTKRLKEFRNKSVSLHFYGG